MQEQHHEHKCLADRGYKFQQDDKRRCEETFPDGYWDDKDAATVDFMSVKGVACQVQDAGGNLRIPRLTVSEAFYKRILQTLNYDVYSHAKRRHSYSFWNEVYYNVMSLYLNVCMPCLSFGLTFTLQVIGEKGVNNVISTEHRHHMTEGSGAEWLILWFDACAGQMCNWTEVMYHCHITDPDLGMHMYARVDCKIPIKGHTFLECDRGFGEVIRAAKGIKIISDMQDWMDIAATSNQKHPPLITKFTQEMHLDWQLFLGQFYSKGRTDIDNLKALLQGSKWRSYGASEELIKGEDGEPDRVETVSHPGEVWLRYSHDVTEPWTKIDMRAFCKKSDRFKYARDTDGRMANMASEVAYMLISCHTNSLCFSTWRWTKESSTTSMRLLRCTLCTMDHGQWLLPKGLI